MSEDRHLVSRRDMVRTALGAFPADFTAMAEARRENYLRTLEGSPFFGFVYEATIAGLYGDPTVSALLGYDGSSVEYGGYRERGFDDIASLTSATTTVRCSQG